MKSIIDFAMPVMDDVEFRDRIRNTEALKDTKVSVLLPWSLLHST
ncbi:MAG: hypothetical protein AAGE59_38115 [Cyanobacteria bacterium P01_F01_bin.86]